MLEVDQSYLKEKMNPSAKLKKYVRGYANAYQAFMPEAQTQGTFAAKKEKYEKLAGVSAAGTVNMTEATYMNPMKQDDEKTVAEKLMSEQNTSAQNRSNEAAIVANTTSGEDLKKMSEDGFSVTQSDTHTIITVTDEIKAVLAKAGVDISVYGDNLTAEQLKDITGNPVVTDRIKQILAANDLPATDANVQESAAALEKAAGMPNVSEDAMVYMLKNSLEPTIQNLYTAGYAGQTGLAEAGSYASQIDFGSMEGQIAGIIESAGLEVNETTMEQSKWLIAHQIPLTKDNLVYVGQLQELSGKLEEGTVDWNEVIDSMAKAIAGGKRPEQGLMITARRKLEETRLAMTTEASRAMLRRGIEIDTKPLEALVEDLKEQERQYYRALLMSEGVEATDGNVETFAETLEVFEEMKGQPAYVLGQVGRDAAVEEVHDTGEKLQRELEKANERYEPLMTAPRADMGDSIQKAFGNVDDILTDLGLDKTDNNRRAVRILAYNEMPLTQENISSIRAMDEEMQRAFKNMTPAVTLEMIRKGINPLDMTVEELNHAAELIKQETGNEEQERFSKYLWKLEQNNEISEEERSSYIGIYRLIAQVEKTDGAALGSLLNQGSDITMRNLLTSMRSTRKTNTDYRVDDDFEGVQSKAKGPRIDDQIEAGYQQNCLRDVLDHISPEKIARLGAGEWENMTPEQLAAALKEMETSEEEQLAEESYIREQLDACRQVLSTSQDVYTYLDRYDIANSVANIMAVSEMLRRPNQMMDRLWRKNAFSKNSMEKIADLKAKVLADFGESLKNPEELAEAQEKLADVAEHVMDTMLIEDPDVKTLDVKELRQMAGQFKLCAKKAREESYMVPIQTGDTVTGVSLKIVRGREKKGAVDILFQSYKMGKVAASFQAKEQGISGMIATNDKETCRMLNERLELLASAMQEGGEEPEEIDIHVAYASDLSLERYEMAGLQREEKMREAGELTGRTEERSPVQTARLYHIAESFIQSIQEFLN